MNTQLFFYQLRHDWPWAIISLLVTLMFLAWPLCSRAAEDFSIGTGGKGGTYYQMCQQMREACQTEQLNLTCEESSGSVFNLDNLLTNKVNSAWVQLDVLFLTGQTRNLSAIKQLFALHPEEVHLVALNVEYKEGGYGVGKLKLGEKTVVLNTVADLGGKLVGAVGGSKVTAEVIQLLGGIPFEIKDSDNNRKEFDSNDQLLAALQNGQIHVALMVGGQPMSAVAALDKRYKLLPIPSAVASKLSRVYRPATLDYPKMGAKAVETISTDAVFVTRDYRKPATVAALTELRACLDSKLVDFKETKGMHAKWQDVREEQLTKPENRAKWP